MLLLPAFGECAYTDCRESETTRVVLLENVGEDSFGKYCAYLMENGFQEAERQLLPHRCFAAFQKGSTGVFVNWFAGTCQLQLVEEENCNWFAYEDAAGEPCVEPRLTQLFLHDYGLSDAVRLPDGRLILIDGGNVIPEDIDNLYCRLKKDSPWDVPVIAAWILTHPHCDHYFAFFPFIEKYGDKVVLQKLIYNFPGCEETERYPALLKENATFAQYLGVEQITEQEILKRFRKTVADLGIPAYTPHTGTGCRIGDAKLHFYGSMDDTVHISGNLNASSLMFTMELAGQRIFLTGDGFFGEARLAERYGSELKCDILQVPHHGFGAGSEEGQIAGFRCVAPETCLLPVEKHLAYTKFCTYREGTQYLMTRMNVREMRTGETEQTISLPYTPAPDGGETLRENYLKGRDDTGARTWIFTQLNTGRQEDFWFSILNSTYLPAEISVELWFEDMQRKILYHDIAGPRLGIFRVCCLPDPNEDPDGLWQQLPENTNFAVRFISNLPVVISHPDHTPAYHSSVGHL